MRLCVFEPPTGRRLGHVRRNHVVDLTGLDPTLPTSEAAVAASGPDLKRKLAAFADSCPHPGTLLRKETLRIVEEWDEPIPSS